MQNHLPLIGRKPPNHAAPTDSAVPHWPITCPTCRAMLQAKVTAHSEEALRNTGQTRQFFAADAAYWQSVLDRGVNKCLDA